MMMMMMMMVMTTTMMLMIMWDALQVCVLKFLRMRNK